MELIRKIKKMNPSVRTLLMSAFEIDTESLEDSIKQQNINTFLQKPMSLEDLCSEVNTQINTFEMQKENSWVRT